MRKNFLLSLVIAMFALELFAIWFGYEVIAHGTGGMQIIVAMLAVIIPLVGLVGTWSSYRSAQNRP